VGRALWNSGEAQWVEHYGIVDSSVGRALWDSGIAQWVEGGIDSSVPRRLWHSRIAQYSWMFIRFTEYKGMMVTETLERF